MYIDNIEIGGYIPFDNFAIKRLNISAINPIQIVTGDNGSGKSSLLKEAFPLPGTRSLYKKEGYKKIIVRHNNRIYEISSVFNKKLGMHSFKEDGCELNVNNTATLQATLCESKLGYTSLVHDLTHCSYKWCNMSNGERKALLMKLAPSTPTFLIDLYKTIKTKYREAKANLNLLYTRKKEIEDKLLPKETLSEYRSKLEKINTAKRELENYIYLVENEYKKIADSLSQEHLVTPDIEKIRRFKKTVYALLMKGKVTSISALGNDDISLAISKCEAKLAMLENSNIEEGKKLQTLYNERDSLVSQLDIIKEKGDITKQSKLLEEIYKEFESLQCFKDIPLYKKEELSLRENIITQVQDILNDTILNSSTKCTIPRSECIATLRDNLNTAKNLLDAITYQKNNIDESLANLHKRMSNLPKPPSIFREECTTCGYFNCHIGEDITCRKEQDKLNTASKNINEEYTKANNSYNALKEEYTKQEYLFNVVNRITDVFSRLPDWRRIYNRSTLTEVLNDGAWKFITDLQFTLKSQEKVARYNQLAIEIKSIETKLATLKEANLPALEMIESIIGKKDIEIASRMTKCSKLHTEMTQLSDILKAMQTRNKLEDIVDKIKKDISTYDEEQSKRLSISFLKDKYIPALLELKDRYTTEAFTIEKVIREQESLLARYNDEILMLITRTTQDKVRYELGEAILSPESGMPKSHLIGYVNSLIKNVNFILSKICTYPFYIDELKITDDFSCDFIAHCNDNQRVPLASLSKGQTSIMNFAWSIALIFAEKLTNYPIVIDECTDGLDEKHKQNFLEWVNLYSESNYTSQMWLVDHDAAMSTGFASRDLICLHKQNVTISEDANVNVVIEQ